MGIKKRSEEIFDNLCQDRLLAMMAEDQNYRPLLEAASREMARENAVEEAKMLSRNNAARVIPFPTV